MLPHFAVDRAFRDLLAHDDDAIDLTEGALLIAAWIRPSPDADAIIRDTRATLDGFATAVEGRLPSTDARERAIALLSWLTRDLGFRGNQWHYDDPRNSQLPEVVRRRVGIPITLSVVYLHLARQLQLAAFGAPMPGHFIVGVSTESGPVYLDVFHGAVVTTEELARRVTRLGADRSRLASYLAPASPRQILYRMLQNLKAIYRRRNEPDTVLRILDWVVVLAPDSPEDLLERGMLAFTRGEYGRALLDLSRAA
ncbi:MAG: transglutaminase-like domain-containing protein, partial [Dehalococcoidia bacterium]|nr:transglutaminase-like domain-containing protein [Dehalococcoidia bacterium]